MKSYETASVLKKNEINSIKKWKQGEMKIDMLFHGGGAWWNTVFPFWIVIKSLQHTLQLAWCLCHKFFTWHQQPRAVSLGNFYNKKTCGTDDINFQIKGGSAGSVNAYLANSWWFRKGEHSRFRFMQNSIKCGNDKTDNRYVHNMVRWWASVFWHDKVDGAYVHISWVFKQILKIAATVMNMFSISVNI